MKRLLFILLIMWLLTAVCFADTLTDELYGQFGVGSIEQNASPKARELFEDMTGEPLSIANLLTLSPAQFFEMIKGRAFSALLEYKAVLLSAAGAVLLCSVITAMGDKAQLSGVFGFICVLSVAAALCRPVLECLTEGCQTVREAAMFMLGYVPVYAAVAAAGGGAAGAAAYHTAMLAASQLISQLAAGAFLPLTQAYLLIALSGAISREKGLISLSRAAKKLISWSLVLITTAFSGLLSLQSLITSSADSAGAKTVRFLAGSFIPVVGGAISDAFSAVQGSIQVIKAGVGGFGILAIALTFLPVLIKITALRLIVGAAEICGEMLSAEQIKDVLSGFSGVLSVMTAIIVSVLIVMTVSTAVMLSFGGGMVK